MTYEEEKKSNFAKTNLVLNAFSSLSVAVLVMMISYVSDQVTQIGTLKEKMVMTNEKLESLNKRVDAIDERLYTMRKL